MRGGTAPPQQPLRHVCCDVKVEVMSDPGTAEEDFRVVHAAADRMCAAIADRPGDLRRMPVTVTNVGLVKQLIELGCPHTGGLRLVEAAMAVVPLMLRGGPGAAGAAPPLSGVGLQCAHLLVDVQVPTPGLCHRTCMHACMCACMHAEVDTI